jgi:hypothetical protein
MHKRNLELIDTYLAVKRDGAVISASDYLTWTQAHEALALLNEKYAEPLNKRFLELVREHFKVTDQPAARPATEDLDPSLNRGLVFRSNIVPVVEGEGEAALDAFLSFSITICVKLADDTRKPPIDVSRSKIWQTAIIECKQPLLSVGEGFVSFTKKLEKFFKLVRRDLRDIYQGCLQSVNRQMSFYEECDADPEFSYITFQQPDESFRQNLDALLEKKTTIAAFDPQSKSVFALANSAYGDASLGFLHFDRNDAKTLGNSVENGINSMVFSDRHGGKGFFVYSWRDRVKTRFVGVTSSTEFVEETGNGPVDRAYLLAHTPASVLSAGLVAQIAQRY